MTLPSLLPTAYCRFNIILTFTITFPRVYPSLIVYVPLFTAAFLVWPIPLALFSSL
jgi:hypothetical protein